MHLVDTTSILATLSLLQNQPEFVALVSIDVARQCLQHHRICILPLLYWPSEALAVSVKHAWS